MLKKLKLKGSMKTYKTFWNQHQKKMSFLPAFLVAQRLKRLPPLRETWAQSLGWKDSPEK